MPVACVPVPRVARVPVARLSLMEWSVFEALAPFLSASSLTALVFTSKTSFCDAACKKKLDDALRLLMYECQVAVLHRSLVMNEHINLPVDRRLRPMIERYELMQLGFRLNFSLAKLYMDRELVRSYSASMARFQRDPSIVMSWVTVN